MNNILLINMSSVFILFLSLSIITGVKRGHWVERPMAFSFYKHKKSSLSVIQAAYREFRSHLSIALRVSKRNILLAFLLNKLLLINMCSVFILFLSTKELQRGADVL